MLAKTIEAHVSSSLTVIADLLLDDGRTVIVRNCHKPERGVQFGISPPLVKVPKVRDRGIKLVTFNQTSYLPTCAMLNLWKLRYVAIPHGHLQRRHAQGAQEVLVGPGAK